MLSPSIQPISQLVTIINKGAETTCISSRLFKIIKPYRLTTRWINSSSQTKLCQSTEEVQIMSSISMAMVITTSLLSSIQTITRLRPRSPFLWPAAAQAIITILPYWQPHTSALTEERFQPRHATPLSVLSTRQFRFLELMCNHYRQILKKSNFSPFRRSWFHLS